MLFRGGLLGLWGRAVGFVSGEERSIGGGGVTYHHAMDAGGGRGEGAAVAVYWSVDSAATCWRTAAGLSGDKGRAVA